MKKTEAPRAPGRPERPAPAAAAAGALALALLAAGAPAPASAQEGAAPRIVALVNDEPFTRHDLEQRVSLALFASGVSDTPETRAEFAAPVLDAMVDEYLQVRDALRAGLSPNEERLQEVLEGVAARNGLTMEGFLIELERRGISRAILEENIASQLLWSANVARRYRPRIRVADSEVDTALAIAIAAAGEPHVDVAEIVLLLPEEGLEEETGRAAAALSEAIRDGETEFAEAARAFSSSGTAGVGGALGWIPEGRLSEARRAALAGLEPGETTEAVREPGGWAVLRLLGRRDGAGEEVRPSLLRFTLPPGADEEDAEEARASLGGCRGMRRLVAAGEEGAADIGPFRPGELAGRTARLLAGLPTGEPSASLAPPPPEEGEEPTRGPSFYLVCPPGKGSPEWNRAFESLARERLDALLRNTQRRLRREAQIEFRL